MINSHQVIGDEIPIQKSTAVTELRSLKSSPEAVMCNVATQSVENLIQNMKKDLM